MEELTRRRDGRKKRVILISVLLQIGLKRETLELLPSDIGFCKCRLSNRLANYRFGLPRGVRLAGGCKYSNSSVYGLAVRIECA